VGFLVGTSEETFDELKWCKISQTKQGKKILEVSNEGELLHL